MTEIAAGGVVAAAGGGCHSISSRQDERSSGPGLHVSALQCIPLPVSLLLVPRPIQPAGIC